MESPGAQGTRRGRWEEPILHLWKVTLQRAPEAEGLNVTVLPPPASVTISGHAGELFLSPLGSVRNTFGQQQDTCKFSQHSSQVQRLLPDSKGQPWAVRLQGACAPVLATCGLPCFRHDRLLAKERA